MLLQPFLPGSEVLLKHLDGRVGQIRALRPENPQRAGSLWLRKDRSHEAQPEENTFVYHAQLI